ncbi:threonine synthase [Clostridium carnis]
MKFMSTRGGETNVSSSRAIINGIAKDGGLYVPETIPKIFENIKSNSKLSYENLAFKIIREFFTDFSEVELKGAINEAYKNKFTVKEENGFLELYHGPTSAFKDAALLFLPQIMKIAKKKCKLQEDIVILTATSGDTGKAALEGFSDIDGFKVVVYYPKNGVSLIQERQMSTQKGKNVKVIGIRGNFDNAQSGVKEIFSDILFREKLKKKGYILSSANSINIGRLVPQIVYYFYGYFDLVNKQKIKMGEEINVVVPTGNFGNILASYYAKEMGLPIAKFICASNENKVLTDFFNDGIYDKRRDLILTESPSMDILISSNLERLLYEAYNRNGNEINKLMNSLKDDGVYKINSEYKEFMKNFYADYADIKEVYKAIKKLYEEENYLMDTHTAVAYVALNKYINKTKDKKQYLIASTASPYKFPRSICNALGLNVENKDDFKVLEALNEFSKVPIPNNLKNLEKQEILHYEVWNKEEMKDALSAFLR